MVGELSLYLKRINMYDKMIDNSSNNEILNLLEDNILN